MNRTQQRQLRVLQLCMAGVLIASSAPALALPRYVADLIASNDLDAGVVNGAAIRFLAGPKFATLVPASQQEICHILLDYYSGAAPGITTVRIVDAATQATVSCE